MGRKPICRKHNKTGRDEILKLLKRNQANMEVYISTIRRLVQLIQIHIHQLAICSHKHARQQPPPAQKLSFISGISAFLN